MTSEVKPEPVHLIDAVAKMVGLSQKRLRDYERLGLVKPLRQARTNNRLYSTADVERVRHIKRLIHAHGFTLKCMQYFIANAPCWTIFQCERKSDCPAYGEIRQACYEVMAAADCTPTACEKCPVYLNRDAGAFALLNPND